jgi:hypothetical protein
VARNEKLGNETTKMLEAVSCHNGWNAVEVRFGSARRDLGTAEEIKEAAEDIARWAGDEGIEYLFQSQGEPRPFRIHQFF